MDDVVIEFVDHDGLRSLDLQAKESLTISAATSNVDFRAIISKALETRARPEFRRGRDGYGLVTEHTATDRFRDLERLVEWSKASPTGAEFASRFADTAPASAEIRHLRAELRTLINPSDDDDEADFYRHFVALKIGQVEEGGAIHAEYINRLQDLVVSADDGSPGDLLFDRLRRLVRDGAGKARSWTRATLLAELRGVVRLRISPSYKADIEILDRLSREALADVGDTVDDCHVARDGLHDVIRQKLAVHRLVNLSGLPGCGKSAVLARFAGAAAEAGPILFLKSDRLSSNTWSSHAALHGLRHTAAELLAEIRSTGTPILFIDGIDRLRPDHKKVVEDLLRVIEQDDTLSSWRVLASSRDQGLEAYRAWFPPAFYREGGIGDVTITPFDDDEAKELADKKPQLRNLLFGVPAVREIARRPFFAAVLAQRLRADAPPPQTETDLITAWWSGAGHDAPPDLTPQRQRALLDLAETGVRNLGKHIPARALKDSTFPHIASLKADLIIRDDDGGASFSFTHDIFFEWTFLRLLIDLGDGWTKALHQAGEPPLLGRVVGLRAQHALTTRGRWTEGYRKLESADLRPQWRREWLTAPPFSSAFASAQDEFLELTHKDDGALLEKLLVWFQAQHTVPSPVVLGTLSDAVEGIDNLHMADLLGWPSDFRSWGRFLDWVLARADALPVRFFPLILEVFGVWQNALADVKNSRSQAILQQCNAWLEDLERHLYVDARGLRESRWNGLSRSKAFATGLRNILLRAARSYPNHATALFRRAVASADMRSAAYSDLMAFTTIMAEVDADLVVDVTKAELIEELPKDRSDRLRREQDARYEQIKRVRAIPKDQRSKLDEMTLNSAFIPESSFDLDDVGIDRYHNYYRPASARHEPFASLFAKAPSAALRLVRDLTNHATNGWRQVHELNRQRMGTPLPVTLTFPWGEQKFWGDWHVFSWSLGQLAAEPIECAYLATAYWAFTEIENGRSAGDVIRQTVEGSESFATLALALRLALETFEVSEVTMQIVGCQRLWRHDLARVVQHPMRDIDLFGIGFLSRLTGEKAKAKAFLDSRASCSRHARDLAMRFPLSKDEDLRERFKTVLAGFPSSLPYEFEEAVGNPSTTAALLEDAKVNAGIGDIANYSAVPVANDQLMVTYERPEPLSPVQEARLAETTGYLKEQGTIAMAVKSLSQNRLEVGWSLDEAIHLLKRWTARTCLRSAAIHLKILGRAQSPPSPSVSFVLTTP